MLLLLKALSVNAEGARVDPSSSVQASCATNREEHGGRDSVAQIIVGNFASYLLIDDAKLSIRRVE